MLGRGVEGWGAGDGVMTSPPALPVVAAVAASEARGELTLTGRKVAAMAEIVYESSTE